MTVFTRLSIVLLIIIQGLMYQRLLTAQNANSGDLNKIENPTRIESLSCCGHHFFDLNILGKNSLRSGNSLNPDIMEVEGLTFTRSLCMSDGKRLTVNGAVGKKYFIQLISESRDVGIFNKDDGNLAHILPADHAFCDSYMSDIINSNYPFSYNPIILYDEQAELFVALARIKNINNNPDQKDYLSFSTIKFIEDKIQIHKWAIMTEVCDNPRLGIQRDGYYISINPGSNDSNIDEVFVINRYEVINKPFEDVTFLSFRNPARPNTLNGFHHILPIDIDGVWPAGNTPGMFITIADDDQGNPSDEIRLYELEINWQNLWASTFKMSEQIPVGSFENTNQIMIPNNGNNILESNSGVLSHRAQYRIIDDQEVITCIQTITDVPHPSIFEKKITGLKWYQLQRDNNNPDWSLYQEGLLPDTPTSDNHCLFNGTIAMNANGDVMIGYLSSSFANFPEIWYCGQSNSTRKYPGNGVIDIPSRVLKQGRSSQLYSDQLGSFSNMSCDPEDDRTFWYTDHCVDSNEPGGAWATENCNTIIAALTVIDCSPEIQSSNLNTIAYDATCIYGHIERGDGDHVMVVARKQETPISEPIRGYYYRDNIRFGYGDTTGPGNYVVNLLPKDNGYGEPNYILINNLEPGNGYYIDIYEANKLDDGSYCYKLPAYTSIVCTQGIPLPYRQSFDNWPESSPGYCCTPNGKVPLIDGWLNNIDDDIDWDILSGKTKSSLTGPTTDISLIGNYMYSESSSCYNKTGYLTSPSFDLTTIPSPELNFYYHMWGNHSGSLSVEVSVDGGLTWSDDVWKKEEDQGNQWHVASVPLSSYSQEDRFRLRFKSVTGNSWTSDIAIDEITIQTQVSEIPYLQTFNTWQTSSPWYSCTADGSVELTEQWKNATGDDVDWDVNSGATSSDETGPSSGYMGNGNYLYLESSGCYGKTGYLESPVFDLSGSNYPELKFYYHMYCSSITYDGMGSLKLEVSTDYGDTWEPIWFVEGNQGNQWNEVTISLNPYNHIKDFVFRFTGKTGSNYMSDIAIDHVSIDSPCESVFTFPYTMGFDSWTTGNPNSDCTPDGSVTLEECWLNVNGDDIDWDIHSGSTSSSGTGPASGYNGIGNYLYLESSYCWHKKASVKSPIFDFSISHMRKPKLYFQYHMNGESMGSLQLDISKNGGSDWENDCLFSIYGNQGNQWNSATINLQEYLSESHISFRFTGSTGNDYTSDMAIDEIEIFDECARLNLPYEEGFEDWVNFSCQSDGYCNPNGSMDLLPYCWENSIDNDFDWGVRKGETPSSNTGPSSGSYGSYRYLYTEVSGRNCYNSEASVQSPDYDMSVIHDQPLLYFNYHMYGEEMGSLSVKISTDFGHTWTNLWTKSGNQGNQWLYAVIPLTSYISNPYVRFKFKAISGPGFTSDIAIDNIKISAGGRENTSDVTTIQEGQKQENENAESLSLNVFPNPNNGIFNLVINTNKINNKSKVNIKIVNTMGNTIYKQDNVVITGTYLSEINLSKYPKGAYYMIVTSNENDIVKEKIIYN